MVSTTLLGFVGVFALNKSFQANIGLPFSPVISCVVEYSTVDPQSSGFSSSNWKVIFDNYFQKTFVDNEIVESNDDNTLSIKTELIGGVNSTFYIKVTNYTSNMILKSSISSLVVNGQQKNNFLNANTLVSINTSQTEYMTVTVMGDKPYNTLLVSLKIQEAYLVDFSMSSNLLNQNFYVAGDEDLVVNLLTAKGTFLPNTVYVFIDNLALNQSNFVYDRANSTLTILKETIIDDIDIDCDATTSYFINEYTVGTKPTGHNGTNAVTYNYYVEIGEYPQSIKLGGVTVTGSQTNGSVGAGSDGETYVYTTSTITELTAWYKVEPLRWTVIGTNNGSDYSLSQLYYKNGAFYTDSRKGKPYTGGLLLMSELAIDGCEFDDANTNFGTNSTIYNFLNTTFAQTSGLNTYFSTAGTPNGNLISYQTMETYGYNGSAMNYYSATANVFLLGGIYEAESNQTAQTYYFKNYFQSGVYGTSIATTSPTAYALAHNVYTSSSLTTYQRTWTPISGTTTNLSCGWWLRSGQSQTTACMVNLTSNVNTDIVQNYAYGVRPCIVLNL